ncbi:helix-turn-helix domain-containing protein [Vibrio cholerae]|uniref:helix-turn-helix domain-containing protein n=1 Tax=Vibrio cholerae TaxID=666 RepID=UPI002AB5B3A6|nr:helix-turn-helix domain-containing protein [Vibrio cholerae]MDY7588613.1 helix-turn-helix domain-containing protein [Vibrio cholerae]
MLSILEVCQMTGKSEKTIYRMMSNGKLPYSQIEGKRFVEEENVWALIPNKASLDKKDSLEQKISTLTNEIIRLSDLIESLIDSKNTYQTSSNDEEQRYATQVKRQHKISSNEMRAQKAKSRLFEELDKLKETNEIPMYRNAPSVTGIHKITGIDRGTISKYLSEWVLRHF